VPLVMDVHEIADGVAKAHLVGPQAQATHDIQYLRYWVDERAGRAICLAEAPSAEAAAGGRRQARPDGRSHLPGPGRIRGNDKPIQTRRMAGPA
jgi:hypothetical protein